MENTNEKFLTEEKQNNRKFNLIFVGIILFISFLLQIILFIKAPASIWMDEAYSLNVMRQSWAKMWAALIKDVHPPLYYLIIKSASCIVGYRFRLFKFLSALSIFLMHIWIATLVLRDDRYQYQKKTAILLGLFIMATTFTDDFLFLSTELRMYSWATFFVTMSGVYAVRFYKKGDYRNAIIFVLMSLGAGLSHYYALFMACYIYLVLFLFILFKKRERLKKFLLIVGLTIIGYAWWLPFGWHQFTQVRQSFWVTYSFKDITSYFSKIVGFNFKVEMIVLLFIIGEAVYGCLFTNKKNTESVVIGLLNMSVFFFTVVIGFILNFSIRPMLIPRYVYPALGLFWIGIFEILDQMPEYKKLVAILLAGILCYVALSAYPKRLAQEYETGSPATVEFIKKNISAKETIYSTGNITWPLAYYFPKNQIVTLGNDSALNAYLNSSSKKICWYLTTQKISTDDKLIQQNGYTAKKVYSGNIDNKEYFDCYKLTPNN
ncbi:MAG: hypothetical protein ACI39G_06160 [Pseudoramibacter sp.]